MRLPRSSGNSSGRFQVFRFFSAQDSMDGGETWQEETVEMAAIDCGGERDFGGVEPQRAFMSVVFSVDPGCLLL